LDVYPKCILSGISMPEVLIAAHIKPVEYKGGYEVSNGFLMRTDLSSRCLIANQSKD
jgi:hypothetical protein